MKGMRGLKLALARSHTLLPGSLQQSALVTRVWPAHGFRLARLCLIAPHC